MKPDSGYFQQLHRAYSDDGFTFVPERGSLLVNVSVPDAVVRPDGEVWVYHTYPGGDRAGGIWVSRQNPNGALEPIDCIRLDGELDQLARDPNIVLLDDGRYQLVFGRSQRAETLRLRPIYSTVSEDGINYKRPDEVFEAESIADPSQVQLPDGSWMMSTHLVGGKKNLINTSDDGSWFQSVAVIPKPGGGELLVLPNGDIRAFVQDTCEAREHGILSYISSDAGKTWTEEAGFRVCPGYNPTVTVMPDGTYVMYYSTDLTPGKNRGVSLRVSEVAEATESFAKLKIAGTYRPVVTGGSYIDADVLALPSGGIRLYTERMGAGIVSFFSEDGISWKPDQGLRISHGAFPDALLLSDGRVRLQYQRDGLINSAISEDGGLTFVQEPGIRVPTGWHGDLDRDKVGPSTTVLLSNGKFRMYYRGDYSDDSYFNGVKTVILSAISEDGLNWAPEDGVRVAPEDWVHPGTADNRLYVDDPEAVVADDGRVHLYFWGMGMCYGTCLSVSDDGLSFDVVEQVLATSDLGLGRWPDDHTILPQETSPWLMYFRMGSPDRKIQGIWVAERTESTR